MKNTLRTACVALTAATALLSGCAASTAGGAATSSASAATTTASTLSGSITVLAAASLTESFTLLGQQFEAAYPGTTVTFSFAASGTLATQITQGAPADVFASASTTSMDQVALAHAVASPTTFATNSPEIAVPPGNPAHISTVADLAAPGVTVALCAPSVPIGALAEQTFAKAGVTVTPATLEADVKATLTKVELGEVDAGIVYVTDVKAAGAKVVGIPIPAELSGSTEYPIATVTASTHAELAQAFVDYVLSSDGAAVMTAAGFQAP